MHTFLCNMWLKLKAFRKFLKQLWKYLTNNDQCENQLHIGGKRSTTCQKRKYHIGLHKDSLNNEFDNAGNIIIKPKG